MPRMQPSAVVRPGTPIIIDEADVFVDGTPDMDTRARAWEQAQGRDGVRVEGKVARRGNGLGCHRVKREHAARHVHGGRDQQIARPAPALQELVHLARALERVAGVRLGNHVRGSHPPAEQVQAGNLVFLLGRGERIDMAPRDNDGRRLEPVEPPRFIQATEHAGVYGGKGDQATGGNQAARQHDNGLVGARLPRIEQGRIAGFQRIPQPVAQGAAMQGKDAHDGAQQELAGPAAVPAGPDHEQHQ